MVVTDIRIDWRIRAVCIVVRVDHFKEKVVFDGGRELRAPVRVGRLVWPVEIVKDLMEWGEIE